MIKPNIPRSLDAVSPGLLSVFGGLVHGRRKWPLYLHGRAGRGKTCAALAFGDNVPGALFWLLEELMGHVYESRSSLWYYARKAPLVIVDELGMRSGDSDREYTALKTMADIREHRPAIWISNLAPEQLLTKYDDRVSSRLTCGTVIELTGTDRRRESRAAGA